MILQEDFFDAWSKMESFLHHRATPKEKLKYWQEEVEHLDPFIFRETCRRLQRGDYMPKLKNLLSMYATVEAEQMAKNNETIGCERCEEGRVAFWKKSKIYKSGTWLAYLAACGYCKPARYAGLVQLCSDKSYKGISFVPVYPKISKPIPEKEKHVSVDGENVSPAKVQALLKGSGFGGKPDPKKEAKRKEILSTDGYGIEAESKKEEIWF